MCFLSEVFSEGHCGAHYKYQLCHFLHNGLNILFPGPQNWKGMRSESCMSPNYSGGSYLLIEQSVNRALPDKKCLGVDKSIA